MGPRASLGVPGEEKNPLVTSGNRTMITRWSSLYPRPYTAWAVRLVLVP